MKEYAMDLLDIKAKEKENTEDVHIYVYIRRNQSKSGMNQIRFSSSNSKDQIRNIAGT